MIFSIKFDVDPENKTVDIFGDNLAIPHSFRIVTDEWESFMNTGKIFHIDLSEDVSMENLDKIIIEKIKENEK